MNTNRAELYTKQAYIIDKEKVESVALILSGSYHEQKSMYDRTPYNVSVLIGKYFLLFNHG